MPPKWPILGGMQGPNWVQNAFFKSTPRPLGILELLFVACHETTVAPLEVSSFIWSHRQRTLEA